LKADRDVFEAVTVAAEIISSAEEAPAKTARQPWDYVALAKAFGARGFRVSTVGELQQVLDEELKNEKSLPALVEVVIPKHDLAPQIERLAKTPS
jgi:thiamine pyrophosphate-dependent acetolactate synthase large subunit-like protein